MKLEKVALLAEILGGVAIVVTLIVLVFGLRANTSALQATTLASLADRSQQLVLVTLANPEMLKTNSELAGFSVEDQSRGLYMVATLRLAEETFLHYKSGLIDEQYWQTRARLALTVITGSEIGLSMYENLRGGLIPEFRDWLDEAVQARTEATE